jgi:predicted small lipoprotein YifL
MKRRVLVTLLGMVIAGLTSACGQKGPLFLPETTHDNQTTAMLVDPASQGRAVVIES